MRSGNKIEAVVGSIWVLALWTTTCAPAQSNRDPTGPPMVASMTPAGLPAPTPQARITPSFDEPTSALDPIAAQLIENLLLKLKYEYTIILVTHTLRQAKRVADYVIFLYFGEVIEAGKAKDVFNHPKKPETKAYIKGYIS